MMMIHHFPFPEVDGHWVGQLARSEYLIQDTWSVTSSLE